MTEKKVIDTFEAFMADRELSGKELSAEQMAVVNSDTATLVSAGAGSGKTTVLSYRFLRLLMERKAKVDEILTLTFTKKAASEMYGRIFRLVETVAEYNPLLESQVKDVARANISTLDSGCAEIARTDSMRWGITRDFSLLEDEDHERMIKSITEDLFIDMHDDMIHLMKYFSPAGIYDDLFGYLSKSVNVLTEMDAAASEKAWLSFLDRFAERHVDKVYEMLDAADETGIVDEANPLMQSEGPSNRDSIRFYLQNREWEKLPSFDLRKNGFAKKIYAPLKPLLKEYKVTREILADLHYLGAEATHAVMNIFSEFIRRLSSFTRREGLLSFSDVEALALQILKTNTGVRNHYKRKFRYIMIDEFQDNSNRQKELLYILSEKEELTDTTGVPSLKDLDNTKLFFVGDDKQSIYYFRGADVSVFNNLKNEIVQIGGKHLTMSTNWRSEPGLIMHFNDAFPSVMTAEELSDADASTEEFFGEYEGRDTSRYEAFYSEIGYRAAKPGITPRIVFSKRDASEEEEGDEKAYLDSRENEAEYIADLIREMTGTDRWLLPSKKEGETTRRPSYEDICILFRSTGIQMSLEKVFRGEDIPYTAVSSTSVGIEALSYDLTYFLKLVIYPRDKFSYMEVLRGPFVRLSDDALFSMRDEFRGDMSTADGK